MLEIVVVVALVLVLLGVDALVYWMKHQIDAVKRAVAIQEHTMLTQGEVLKNGEDVHRLMQAVLDILDAPAIVKRWEDYRALVEHEREQLARMQPQDVNEVSAAMVGLMELVSSLLLYMPASQRRNAVDASSVPSFLKERLHRMAAAAPDRSTLTVTLPHVEDRPSSSTSPLSAAQPPRLPAMPSSSPAAEEPQGTSP